MQNQSVSVSESKAYLPSISNKSQSPQIKGEREILKKFLIEKYTQKFTQTNKNKAFIVKKVIEDAFLNNSLSSQTLKKLTQSLETQKCHSIPKIEEISISSPEFNPDNIKLREKTPETKNVPIPALKPQKKLVSEIIPGYRYRKEYYDFDEISLDESVASKKSIYRIKTCHDEWAWLIKNDVDNYRAQINKKKESFRNQQQKFKNELDKQLIEKEQLKEKEKKKEMFYHEIMMKKIRTDEEKELDEVNKKQKNQQMAKLELDKQNELFLQNQTLEKKIDKKLKEILHQQYEKEINEENSKLFMKQKRYRELNQEMMRESNENRQRLLLEYQKEREEDIKMTDAYMKEAEKMLADRETQKRQRMEEIQKKYGNYSESLKQFGGRRKIDSEDEIQLRHFKEKEEEEKQDSMKRTEKIRENKQFLKESLTKQIKEKELMKEKEMQRNQEQADYWKVDTQNFYEEENQKKVINKQRQLKYVEGLKTQSKLNQEIIRPEKKMNDEELLQNKKHLKMLATQNGENGFVYRDFIDIQKKIY